VGRPPDLPFSEASGSFRVETDADPTALPAEEPLVLTLRVTATGPVRKPPRRIPLQELPAFRQAFHIEDIPDEESQAIDAVRLAGLLAGPGPARPALLGALLPQTAWEFRYRLKPKSTAVTEVPSLPFAFYNPAIPFPERRFQVLYADAIPLEVRPREVLEVPLQAPARAFELATGQALLARQAPWAVPVALIFLALLVPPVLCLAWYLIWRRLYPNAAKLASLRRSRAAALALDALQRLPPAPRQRAVVAFRAVTGYLRQRLDLPGEEPTPLETSGHLQRLGCSAPVAGEALRFYRACDAARFLPAAPAEAADLPDQAVRLILALEEEKWNATAVGPPDFSGPGDRRGMPGGSPAVAVLLVFLSVIAAAPAADVEAGILPDLPNEAVIERAEAAFAEGVRQHQDAAKARPHFREAARSLDLLRQRGVRNTTLFRDLGNAWLLAGDLPRAILSYRRGLRLAPGDRALRASLEEARALIVFPSGSSLGWIPPERRPPWLPYLAPDWFLLAAAVLYGMAWFDLTRWLMVRRRQLLVVAVGALVGVALAATGAMVLASQQREEAARPLVVIADDGVLLRRGDNLLFPLRFQTPVNKGVEARLLFARGDWLQIELAGGEVGWVPRGLALVDEPE
jgi:hypothetical protein